MIPVGIDTETELIRRGNVPPLVCMSISGGVLVHHSEASAYVRDLLLNPDLLLIGHNTSFDFCVLAAHDPSLFPLIFDAYASDRITCTQTRQKLIDIAEGRYKGWEDTDEGDKAKIIYDLATVSYRTTGIRPNKGEDTWRLRYGELRDIPCEAWPADARQYALNDADLPVAVAIAQENARVYLEDEFRQARASFWIRLMSSWGLMTDPIAVSALSQRIQGEWQACAEVCRTAGLLRKDGTRDTKAAGNRIQNAYVNSGRAVPRTGTLKPKLDKRSCQNSGDPILVKYAEMSALKKQLTTDIPLLFTGNVYPIQARFEDLVETGRTSSSPNVQNQKTKGGFRECFVPRPGHAFVSCDWTGAELATLAQVCLSWIGKSRLAELLNAGIDPHLTMAAAILGRPYVELEANKRDPEVKNARQCGKIVNFGCPGGLGAAGLVNFAQMVYGVILSEEKARWLKEEIWLPALPEMREYFALINRQIQSNQPIRQLFSNRFRGGCSYTEACNTPFQGLAADMAKHAGFNISRECYAVPESPLFGARIVNFVHDEFILEAPIDRVHEVGHRTSELMRDAARIWVPDVQIKADPCAMLRWSKDAEAVYVDGRLMPWVALQS